MDESHLDSFALDAVHEAFFFFFFIFQFLYINFTFFTVTDGAAHDEEEGEPGDGGRGPRPGQGLVQDLSGEYSQQTSTSHLIK